MALIKSEKEEIEISNNALLQIVDKLNLQLDEEKVDLDELDKLHKAELDKEMEKKNCELQKYIGK